MQIFIKNIPGSFKQSVIWTRMIKFMIWDASIMLENRIHKFHIALIRGISHLGLLETFLVIKLPIFLIFIMKNKK